MSCVYGRCAQPTWPTLPVLFAGIPECGKERGRKWMYVEARCLTKCSDIVS